MRTVRTTNTKLAMAMALLLLLPRASQAAEIAITLDDLPYAMPSRVSLDEGRGIVDAVNRTLKEHGVQAMGFAIGARITPETEPLIASFVQAGHDLGNHSWSHPDYNELTSGEFRTETMRAHSAISRWTRSGNFYRFPFLHQGETPEKLAASSAILAELGYRNVPVSIDDDDFRFNSDYVQALANGDSDGADAIAELYLEHMKERTAFFQNLARERLGRDVKHILLLHMNRINADHLGDLLDWYRSEGWNFIAVREALADPIYATAGGYAGPKGLSQIQRVAGTE
jgi:peptidoglycan/xylan/chitin deacetylase (PgdA/CDA1 family)